MDVPINENCVCLSHDTLEMLDLGPHKKLNRLDRLIIRLSNVNLYVNKNQITTIQIYLGLSCDFYFLYFQSSTALHLV